MQYTNEELVGMIKSGERERLTQLWDQVQAFVRSEAARWVRAWKQNRPDLEFDDLYQCGYIALCGAVETYKTDQGMSFIGWLAFYLKTAFAQEIGCRTSRQQRERQTLVLSLDAPVSADTEEITLGDAVADPEDQYADVEMDLYHEQLKAIMGEAVSRLPPNEREAIRLRYYDELTIADAGQAIGISYNEMYRRVNHGLSLLRRSTRDSGLWDIWYG